MIDGNMISSATMPATKMVSISQPKRWVGVKELVANTESPNPLIRPACSVAFAERRYELRTASERSPRARRSSLYHARKWIVSSTATPSAMLAAIIEPMSTGMPSHPMPPKTTSTGSVLGTITTAPAAKPRQTNIISGVIVMNDHQVLEMRLSSRAC